MVVVLNTLYECVYFVCSSITGCSNCFISAHVYLLMDTRGHRVFMVDLYMNLYVFARSSCITIILAN